MKTTINAENVKPSNNNLKSIKHFADLPRGALLIYINKAANIHPALSFVPSVAVFCNVWSPPQEMVPFSL